VTWQQLPAIWESDLLPLDKLVLLCLCKFANAHGRSAKPAQVTISRLTGIGSRRVRTALATLKQRGLITSEGKGRKGTISYAINLPLANRKDAVLAANPGTVSPTIHLNNPFNKDSNSFDSGSGWSGDSEPRYHRRTRQELVDEEDRERAAMRARLDARRRR